jgi:hypothetical protein
MEGQGEEYSSYSFMTLALDGGEWSGLHSSRAVLPGKGPPIPIVQEAAWTSEPVWTQRLEGKSFCLCWGSNLDRPVVQSVVILYLLSYPGSYLLTEKCRKCGQL